MDSNFKPRLKQGGIELDEQEKTESKVIEGVFGNLGKNWLLVDRPRQELPLGQSR